MPLSVAIDVIDRAASADYQRSGSDEDIATSDWQAIEKDINIVERDICSLKPDPDTAAARLLIAFRNQRDKSATGEDEQLSHLRIVLEGYVTDQYRI